MRNKTAATVAIGLAAPVMANEALLRLESSKNKGPRVSLALIDSRRGWRFWGFGINLSPTLQVGRQLEPVNLDQLQVTPILYLAYQTEAKRVALDPWLIIKKPVGKGLLVAKRLVDSQQTARRLRSTRSKVAQHFQSEKSDLSAWQPLLGKQKVKGLGWSLGDQKLIGRIKAVR